ncbi:TrmJ/YjtD family RNA methyltransferase [Granulosicoccaceae sp. 1_MG-2023]|nr:TrmJ/YjtD family RNA methyltransferase [Granulosicoccaceae sp. 1_MG-2023]
MLRDNVLSVLVQTHHPGNIGSAARALKTMGLRRLALVQARDYPHEEATRLAAGAGDVLQAAQLSDSLQVTLADTRLVVACTARPRGFDLPELDAEQAAALLVEQAALGPVAVLYGPERFGLSNEHLRPARYRVTIPADPDYPSLNLAAAVQLISYEIRKAVLAQAGKAPRPARTLPPTREMEGFYQHLQRAIYDAGFINRAHPGKIMEKLRFLFDRAEPDQSELNILRGILASFERHIRP